MRVHCMNLPCVNGFFNDSEDVCDNCGGTGFINLTKKEKTVSTYTKEELLRVYDTIKDAKDAGYERVPRSSPTKYKLGLATHSVKGRAAKLKIEAVVKKKKPTKPNNNL